MKYTPDFLKNRLEYLNKLDIERLKIMVEIAIYGNETYNYPLAQKYIDEAKKIAPNNIDVIMNRIKIHLFIEPHLIKDDIDYVEQLIERFEQGDPEIVYAQQQNANSKEYRKILQYVKGTYYFATKQYKKAFQILSVNDPLSITYKELAYHLWKNKPIDFSKYKNINENDFSFFIHVSNILNFQAMYDKLYDWCQKGLKKFKQLNQKFYIELLIAQVYKNRGESDKGYQLIEKLYKLAPNDPNLPSLRLCFFQGTKQFDKYWEAERKIVRNIVNIAVTWNIPRLQSDINIDNKNILIVTDQGFGDNLMNYRYLIEFIKKHKDTKFTLMVYKELIELFKLNIPGNINIVPYNHNINTLGKIDSYMYMSHIPMFMNVNKNDIEQLGKKYHMKVDNGKKFDNPTIAIYWKTNPRGIDMIHRSFELEEFLEKIDIKKLQTEYNVISIQKDVRKDEVKLLQQYNIKNYDKELNSFLDTARIIDGIEKIYTIDTGVMHLAGVMNKPINMYLNKFRDCKWGDKRDDNNHYLYPNLKILS